MRPQDVLTFVRAQPFQPFRVTLTDGRSYEVHHPEMAMVGISSMTIGVPSMEGLALVYDRIVTVFLLHIMELEHLKTTTSS